MAPVSLAVPATTTGVSPQFAMDHQGLVDRFLPDEWARAVGAAVTAVPPPYPTKGIDLTVVSMDSVASPVPSPRFVSGSGKSWRSLPVQAS